MTHDSLLIKKSMKGKRRYILEKWDDNCSVISDGDSDDPEPYYYRSDP